MKKSSSVFLTHSVILTDFDQAACSFNNGIFDTLTLKIKPCYCPTAQWIAAFCNELSHQDIHFSITEQGVSYLTIDNLSVEVDDLQHFVDSLNIVIKKVNVQLGNETIVENVPVAAAGLVISKRISTILDSIEWVA
ncbi:hypothetical protein EDF81_0715 [Enterobacter sp. BIGb0383]|uniref:hypothetical protein n=1 Tax=unclassified Enterobacter TaxID=2608935 RepID=UPI000F4AB8FF|nr:MULTISPECIES: hypothetical protein [unclassified Enterobacter]ROP62232.1 hypothetical protein EDF81_0715 [Enterobacter sp. BIGb0383]ROS12393.1 hypothetical protein EC848_0717 [Enterobacter sp. BIGb0359]